MTIWEIARLTLLCLLIWLILSIPAGLFVARFIAMGMGTLEDKEQ